MKYSVWAIWIGESALLALLVFALFLGFAAFTPGRLRQSALLALALLLLPASLRSLRRAA